MNDMDELEMTASQFNMYGNRQDEFDSMVKYSPGLREEIVDYCHAIANLMNYAKDRVRETERAKVVTVCADGFEITQGMIDDEIARTSAPRPPTVYAGPMPQIIGLNASSNQFA